MKGALRFNRMSDSDSELQDLHLEASALACRMRVLMKRMVKTGLTPQASRHMKAYKTLLAQQRAMIMAMQNDLDVCECLLGSASAAA